MNDDAPHSALYLDDSRDAWWNPDWLALLAQRLELGAAREVLDVGCGKGHFTRTLARLAPRAAVSGVDREQAWVEAAAALSPGIAYVQGDAAALPFPDASFDVVACQTLLIHVADVGAVVREMMRVLRPGGRVVAAEPNNLAETWARVVGDPRFVLEDALAFARLQAICERGKHALGLGYNSAGERLCAAFADAGLRDIQAWNNDRCQVLLPRAGAHPALDGDRAIFERGGLVWPEEETRRYFAAGGGEDVDFGALWAAARRAWGVRFGPTYAANEGGLFYVVSGRR